MRAIERQLFVWMPRRSQFVLGASCFVLNVSRHFFFGHRLVLTKGGAIDLGASVEPARYLLLSGEGFRRNRLLELIRGETCVVVQDEACGFDHAVAQALQERA